MPSLTDCNIMSFEDDNTSSCSTSATGENGTSETSIASVSLLSSVSVASRGGSDVSVVFGGSRSRSGRIWISSVPSIAEGMPQLEYNEILAIHRQLIEIIERCDSCMQVMMDDAQAKRRGAKKSVGRRGGYVFDGQ